MKRKIYVNYNVETINSCNFGYSIVFPTLNVINRLQSLYTESKIVEYYNTQEFLKID